jgi:hypothetical protein
MDEMDLTIRRLCRSLADADAYICILGHKKNTWKKLPPDRDQDDRLAVQATLSSLYAYIRQTRLAIASFFVCTDGDS